ncbi:hypothetical protein MBLNU230_g0386t1 [Neophaeotheca triangularis]
MAPSESSFPDQRKNPPPLPPRRRDTSTTTLSPPAADDTPPSYETTMSRDITARSDWDSQDPRTSSQQSLVPSDSNQQNERRKLLCVFIHGFMGDETSFRSFPAHVHNLLTVLLVETHVVHTKIYPRYRSRQNISFARDNFSKWLEPHESPSTDVVLLGHSMGGLLQAEVVLKPPESPSRRPLKHRILGTINFDVPFLGMHPGIIKSGLASIFKPGEEPEDKLSPSAEKEDPLWTRSSDDPHYNPSFQNDVVLPVRKGWRNAWHFVQKHHKNLTHATKQLVTSHLEFGGAMANYSELKARYARIRALEEDNNRIRASVTQNEGAPPRVRFINYYTASHGKSKRPESPGQSPSIHEDDANRSDDVKSKLKQIVGRSSEDGSSDDRAPSQSPSPEISVEEYRNSGVISKEPQVPDEKGGNESNDMKQLAPAPVSDSEDLDNAAESLTIHDPQQRTNGTKGKTSPGYDDQVTASSGDESLTLTPSMSLPAVPDPPQAPTPPDLSNVTDKDTRKLAEKEHNRAVKSYEKTLKDREKVIQERAKLAKKQQLKVRKDLDKAKKDAQKANSQAKANGKKPTEGELPAYLQEAEQEMTHERREMLRLQRERDRMEAEARRMRGESTPEEEPASPDYDTTSALQNLPTIPGAFTGHMTPPGDDRTTVQDPSRDDNADDNDDPPPKDRKFCTLPPKDANGERDPTWVRVFMKDVDEVGAHCGLFFIDERYERLVGDVAERIEGWVRESEGEKYALGMEGSG